MIYDGSVPLLWVKHIMAGVCAKQNCSLHGQEAGEKSRRSPQFPAQAQPLDSLKPCIQSRQSVVANLRMCAAAGARQPLAQQQVSAFGDAV